MTSETAVAELAEIMTKLPELSASIIYEAMQKADIPYVQGHLSYVFTQNAWGRVALDGMGIKPCDEYIILDGDGKVLESGQSSQNAFFTTASQLAQKYRHTAAFEFMAQTSAVVRTVNASLKNGSKPENLILMPDVIFLGKPTEEGLQKVNQIMSEYTDKLRKLYPPKSRG